MGKQTTLLERAADRTADAVEIAREATKEFVENTAKPAVHDAKVKAAPLVAAGATMAAERAAQAREFAETKSYELTGHPKPKRRGRKLLLFALLGVLAAGGVVAARRMLGDSGDWTNATPAGPTSATTPRDPLLTEEPADDINVPPVPPVPPVNNN